MLKIGRDILLLYNSTDVTFKRECECAEEYVARWRAAPASRTRSPGDWDTSESAIPTHCDAVQWRRYVHFSVMGRENDSDCGSTDSDSRDEAGDEFNFEPMVDQHSCFHAITPALLIDLMRAEILSTIGGVVIDASVPLVVTAPLDGLGCGAFTSTISWSQHSDSDVGVLDSTGSSGTGNGASTGRRHHHDGMSAPDIVIVPTVGSALDTGTDVSANGTWNGGHVGTGSTLVMSRPGRRFWSQYALRFARRSWLMPPTLQAWESDPRQSPWRDIAMPDVWLVPSRALVRQLRRLTISESIPGQRLTGGACDINDCDSSLESTSPGPPQRMPVSLRVRAEVVWVLPPSALQLVQRSLTRQQLSQVRLEHSESLADNQVTRIRQGKFRRTITTDAASDSKYQFPAAPIQVYGCVLTGITDSITNPVPPPQAALNLPLALAGYHWPCPSKNQLQVELGESESLQWTSVSDSSLVDTSRRLLQGKHVVIFGDTVRHHVPMLVSKHSRERGGGLHDLRHCIEE